MFHAEHKTSHKMPLTYKEIGHVYSRSLCVCEAERQQNECWSRAVARAARANQSSVQDEVFKVIVKIRSRRLGSPPSYVSHLEPTLQEEHHVEVICNLRVDQIIRISIGLQSDPLRRNVAICEHILVVHQAPLQLLLQTFCFVLQLLEVEPVSWHRWRLRYPLAALLLDHLGAGPDELWPRLSVANFNLD